MFSGIHHFCDKMVVTGSKAWLRFFQGPKSSWPNMVMMQSTEMLNVFSHDCASVNIKYIMDAYVYYIHV